MQNLPKDTFGPQPFDRHRVTIDWWQAGCQWQEGDDGRIAWATVWDEVRFAEQFPGVQHRNAIAVARAIESADVPTMVYDQSMAVWDEQQRQDRDEWSAEQAFDNGGAL